MKIQNKYNNGNAAKSQNKYIYGKHALNTETMQSQKDTNPENQCKQ